MGKVVGSVVSTRKNENLVGNNVLVVQGSAARIGSGMPEAPIDAAIVGIIDEGLGLE